MRTILIALSLCLSGCVAVVSTGGGDVEKYANDTMMKKVDAYAAGISASPKNNAVAFTKGDKPFPDTRWAWAGASDRPTVDAARDAALRDCETKARMDGVPGPCRIYMVNGAVVN